MKPKAVPVESESKVVSEILIEFGATPYCRIYRNNVGMGYGMGYVKQLKAIIMKGLRGDPGTALRQALALRARPVRWGVVGSADIMGWAMGGRVIAIECKRPDEPDLREQQETWRKIFESMGGLYVFAQSVEDVREAFIAEGLPVADARKN